MYSLRPLLFVGLCPWERKSLCKAEGCRCAQVNQVSGLGLHTVLQLCWAALPALVAVNTRLFFLVLLQMNSVEQTLILTAFLKILKHILYILLSVAFLWEKNPLTAQVYIRRGLFAYLVVLVWLCHKLPRLKGKGDSGSLCVCVCLSPYACTIWHWFALQAERQL